MFDSHLLKSFLSVEGESDLSDSASSAGKPWELKYVQNIVYKIEPMFEYYALGRSKEIISPCLYDQLVLNDDEAIPGINQRVLFDCVSECLDLKCRHYLSGGFKLWAKGMSIVRRKDRLAEEVYKEIWDCNGVGDSMIDDLVDRDMTCHYGRWLNFDTESFELGVHIESRILNSLIDEVIADMLLV